MQVRLIKDKMGPKGPIKAGTVIDHPDAHRLVQMGDAEPMDQQAETMADIHEAAKQRQVVAQQAKAMAKAEKILAKAKEQEQRRRAAFEAQLMAPEGDA